jgi:hypothetical protein
MPCLYLIINILCKNFGAIHSRPKGASERDSSGTTEAHEMREGDVADSPTQAHKVREAARPINFASQNLN